MTLRILITVLAVLALCFSMATAKEDPKPASMKALGGSIAPGSLKAARAATVTEKNQINPFDVASKKAPAKLGVPEVNRSGILTEGFETSVPPAGWSAIVANSGFTWKLQTLDSYTGLSSADVEYDPALVPQDEWLVGPALNLTGALAADLKVSFWWNMSYYWGVSPYDGYDLELWISTDGGATFPTKLWDETVAGVFTNWTWYQATVSLTAYASQTNVKLAWRYVGVDGAQALIDDISVNDDALPVGRCCYVSTCTDVTQAACASLGGTWDGTKTCATPCPTPGIGDDCGNPIPVTLPAQIPYTDANQYTCGRLNDYTGGTTCLGYYDGGEDIIYKLDVTAAVDLKITINPNGTTWTGFSIGTSCPPAGTCIVTKTNSGGAAYSADAVHLDPGTYYLMVDTYPAPDCIPDFDLTIDVAGPALGNDNCANATDIGDVTSLPFSTTTATFDGPGGFITGPNIWYRYTATCDGIATVGLCGSSYDTKLRVFDGGACPTTTTSLAENDDACGGALQSSVTFLCVAGNQYMIEVGGYSTSSGDGLLNVSCGLPPETPPNDNCVDVTPVPLVLGSPLTFTGNNAGSTNDCSLTAPDPEVWHAFTTTDCMNVTVDYCGTAPAFGNIYIVLITGCPCGGYLLGTYEFTSCGDGNGTITYENLPAGTWYIPVLNDPSYGASGPYTINVNGVVCPLAPPNDNCEDVTPVALTPGVPAVFTGDNNGATPDCASFPGKNAWLAFTLPTCMNVTLNYCGTTPAFGNAWLNLTTACPCAGFTPAGVYNLADCGDGNVTIKWEFMSAGTYYYPILTEPGAMGPYTINVTGVECPTGVYCSASGTTCDEYISRVAVGTIDNYSGCSNYEDWTALSTPMTQGVAYPILVENGYPYTSDQCGIWVDFNVDFDFTDPGEMITVSGTPGGGPYTANIIPPCGGFVGSTTMRVRIMYTGTVSPCGASPYGEVEDYTIDIQAPPALPPTAVIHPNPQFVYYRHALNPVMDTFYVGQFDDGFTALDVNPLSVTVNGLAPTSVAVIAGYSGFYCQVLRVILPLATFIGNGVLVGTTNTTFTVAGTFTDASEFSIAGNVTIIGKAEIGPSYIIPSDVVVLPGDFNLDGMTNVTDAAAIVNFIFADGAAPANLSIGDLDCNGMVNISDVVSYIAWIFGNGAGPTLCGGK
jgi:hypothetical protein